MRHIRNLFLALATAGIFTVSFFAVDVVAYTIHKNSPPPAYVDDGVGAIISNPNDD